MLLLCCKKHGPWVYVDQQGFRPRSVALRNNSSSINVSTNLGCRDGFAELSYEVLYYVQSIYYTSSRPPHDTAGGRL